MSLLQGITLEKRTPATITDPIILLEELESTRERGYAIDNGEHEDGIKCFAATIKGYGSEIVGAISVTALKRELDNSEQVKKLIIMTIKTATGISHAFGSKGLDPIV